ncbi:MAG: response regulator [Candidatus Woesearchaeota archaeon]
MKEVIWAEDHPMLRDVLCSKFKATCAQQGVEVSLDEVATGDELVERVRRNGYCLAFTDFSMPPGINGLEAIKQIRQQGGVIPIYLFTLHEGMEQKALDAGANGYARKDDFNSVDRLIDQAIELYLK